MTVQIQEDGNKLSIISSGHGAQREVEFFIAIEEAWEKGYKIIRDTNKIDELSFRNYQGTSRGRVVMTKLGEEVIPSVLNQNVDTTEKEKPQEEAPKKKAGRPRNKNKN